MNTSLVISSIIIVLCIFRPAAALSCYQQPYTPGQTNYGYTGTSNLPKSTCPGSANSCFKMVCFGTTYYVVRGCLDFTNPQYNCQTLSQCYTCNGNNCNSAMSLHGNPARLITVSAVISMGIYLFKNLA
ncbi:hypothetical protein M3Y97_00135600 [Aphelenchoides bicaudatus]|nr:hypothetical protein M3Y97_00135600 [Aphelenchoides bicaudatus]